MGTFLEAIRAALPTIFDVSMLCEAFGRIGVLAYHDYCDPKVVRWSGWRDFTSRKQLTSLAAWVGGLRPSGGGDIPEATKTAMAHAIGLALGGQPAPAASGAGAAAAASAAAPARKTVVLHFTDAPAHHSVFGGANMGVEIAALQGAARCWPSQKEEVTAVLAAARTARGVVGHPSVPDVPAGAPQAAGEAEPAPEGAAADAPESAAAAVAPGGAPGAAATTSWSVSAAGAAAPADGTTTAAAADTAATAAPSRGLLRRVSSEAYDDNNDRIESELRCSLIRGAAASAAAAIARGAKDFPASANRVGGPGANKFSVKGPGAALPAVPGETLASDWVALSAAAAGAGMTVYSILDRNTWPPCSFQLWLAAATGGGVITTAAATAANMSSIVINLLLALMGQDAKFPAHTARLVYGCGVDAEYTKAHAAAFKAAGAASAGGAGAAAGAGAAKAGAAAGAAAAGAKGGSPAGKAGSAAPAKGAGGAGGKGPSPAPAAGSPAGGAGAAPAAAVAAAGPALTPVRHVIAHCPSEAEAAGFLLDTRRKADVVSVPLTVHLCPETEAAHHASRPTMTVEQRMFAREANRPIATATAGSVLTGYPLADCAPHPAAATDLAPLLARFEGDESFRERVYTVFGRLLAPSSIMSLTHNPIFGFFWRGICKRRADRDRRAALLAQISQSLEVLTRTAPADAAAVRAWLDASYDASEDVMATIREAGGAHAGLDGPVLVLDARSPAAAGNFVSKAQELLEVVHSCAPSVLARVSGLMAGLRVIQPPLVAAPTADGAGAGAGAAASAGDGKPPLLRLAEGERYLPIGLSDADMFSMLPHLMVKGTTVTTRGAAIFAMIALLTRNELLAGRAASFLASVRGKWLDWENVPENYALSFLRLLLRVAPIALTPAEAARVHFLARLGGMAANGRSVLPIRTPFAPAPKSIRPDFKVACPSCSHARSFTLMAADGRCGLCHADGEAKAKATPEPADTAAGLAEAAGAGAAVGAASGAARSEQPTATLGLSHWCECRACAAQYTVSCPQLMLKGLAPKCHFCRAGGVKAAGGAGKGGKGAKAAAAAAAKKKAAAGAAEGEEEEAGAGICAPTPCVSCASCGNRFIAAHVASLLQASRRAAAAADAVKAPLAAHAAAVAAARAVIKTAAAGSGSAAAVRKAAGGAGASAAAAASPADVANAHAAFTCPSCTAAKLGLWSASTLTEENETSVAALARAAPVGGGATPNWAVLLHAAGLAPAAVAGADDKGSSDGFRAAGSAPAPGSAATVPAALPYDLFAPGAGSVAKTKALFAPLPGYKMVFPRPDGRLPQGVAASLGEAGMDGGAAGDAASAAGGAGSGSAAATAVPLLWHKGKPVLNTSALLGDLASWAVSASAQAGECSLCFETVHRGQLASACGRSGCAPRACAACLKAFYSAATPGALLPPSALCCPFCKRTPTRAAIKTANPALCVLLMSTGGVPPALDPAWHYGWCKTCMLPKPLLEKTCARDAPEPTGWDCGDCIRVRRERERIIALNRALDRAQEAAGAAARAATAATAAALVASGAADGTVTAVRPCPNPACGVAIYKDGGCDHVTCGACDAHICWRCGKTFDDAGDCYGHLDDAHGSYFSEDGEADPTEFVAAAWMGWRQHQVRMRAAEAEEGEAVAEAAAAARAAAIAATLGGISPEEAAALQEAAGVDFMQWMAEAEGEAAVLARLGALRPGAGAGAGDAAGGGGAAGGAGGAGGR